MLSWKILMHSVRMVLRNLPAVFRIFWAPTVLSVLALVAFVYVSGLGEFLVWGEHVNVPAENLPRFFLLWGIAAWLVTAVIGAWGVTTWHRFILLEKFSSGLVPEFHIGRAVGYVLRLFLLGLIALIILLPVGFVLMAVVQAAWPVGLALLVAVLFLLGVLMFRWSLILPAFAVGNPLTMSESWKWWETIGNPGRTAFGLVFFYVVVQFLIGLVVEAFQFSPVLHSVLSLVVQVFFAILNVSILTTLYGYIVEKRELS
ncbi:hypothetical protein [Ruegeria halocynthiae]|uniref:hypothetical protein n=1 Tax=Ruegeria halocynthiae TaxID=985054 RepID=UPI0005642ADC|nr:hypothetical protein [Ruegeria halocynthiae]